MALKKNKETDSEINFDNMPKHIAFICDGNRRWARSRALPTLLGHKEGVEAIKRVVKRASEIGLQNLTFSVFQLKILIEARKK